MRFKVDYMIVGIDFGTCYSSISVMVGNKPVHDYVKDSTGLGIPSIYLYHDGHHYGEDCEVGRLKDYRGNILRKIKKKIRENPDSLGIFYTAEHTSIKYREIVENYLDYLIKKLVAAVKNDNTFIGSKEIEEIAISGPVAISSSSMSYTDYREFLKKTLMKITHLDEEHVHVIDEPAAAAISYLYAQGTNYHITTPQKAMVFDLGGGTLDIALIEHDPGNMSFEELVPSDGDLNLGGDNWDECLKQLILEKAEPPIPVLTDPGDIYDFERELVTTKQELSKYDEYEFELTIDSGYYTAPIKREDFEARTKPLLDHAIKVMRNVLDSYTGGIAAIDKIVLVGGSCLMPQIRNRIIEEFKHQKDESDILLFNPSKATANGAAIFAAMHHATGPGVKVKDRKAEHTYGMTVQVHDKVMVSNLIFRGDSFGGNSFIEATYADKMAPSTNSQERVRFEIYESNTPRTSLGEDDLKEKPTNDHLMCLYVPVPDEYYTKATAFRFFIEMKLTSDNILKVTARDIKTKATISTVRSK